MDAFSAASAVASATLNNVFPFVSLTVAILAQVLTARTLEEDLILFRTRSQHIGSLSAVSAFLAAVQAQFISFTYQKNDSPLQKAAGVSFILGVSLNVMGAATGVISASAGDLPNLTTLQEELVGFQNAINEAVELVDSQSPADAKEDRLRSWGRAHHSHVTHMFVTGSQIARWNTQSFVYALVMIAGVGVFFLGLLFFIIDSQPRVVWLTTLLISGIAYILIVGVQLFCGFLASIRKETQKDHV